MIKYDTFVNRQFKPTFAGTKIPYEIKDELLEAFNNSTTILDSPWDFCKYVVIENTFNIKCATMPITLDVYPFIRTDYSSRTPQELPILSRFVQLPPGYTLPNSNYVVAVLYSRGQLLEEFNQSKKSTDDAEFLLSEDTTYGIVAVMGTEYEYPDPMVPITIMRNALGMDEGGNGETLNRDLYNESVEFWSKNILIK